VGAGAARVANRGVTARVWLLHTYLPAQAPEPSCYACNFQPPGIFENKIPRQYPGVDPGELDKFWVRGRRCDLLGDGVDIAFFPIVVVPRKYRVMAMA